MKYEILSGTRSHLTHQFTGDGSHIISGEYWDKVNFSFLEMRNNRQDKRFL